MQSRRRAMMTAWAVAAGMVLAPTAVLAARESISNQLSIGICRSSSLTPDMLNMCSRDGRGATAADKDGPLLWQSPKYEDRQHRLTGGKGHDHDHAAAVWTHTGPCYGNASDGMEFCVYASSTFADGHGITIITTPERAESLLQKPAFVHAETVHGVNRPLYDDNDDGETTTTQESRPPLGYEVVAMPGKGFGVVATKHFQRGDRIMSATASIVVDYGLFETAPEKTVLEMQAVGVGYLPEKHQARLMNLSTHTDTNMSHNERLAKIMSTNAFDLEGDDDNEYGLYVVFPEISRLNHDCRPNSDYHFDYETLTHHVFAVRPIAAGEEITVSYMDLIETRKRRQAKLLNTWGFQCSCSLCTQAAALTQASDGRLALIKELRGEFQDYSTQSRATPQMAELFVSLYQQERLDAMLYEAYAYLAIEWNGVGEPWLAMQNAHLALEYGLLSVGMHDVDVAEMRLLAADPWSHWSWMLRTSRRMQWGLKDSDGAFKMAKGREKKKAAVEEAQEAKEAEPAAAATASAAAAVGQTQEANKKDKSGTTPANKV